MVDSDEGSNGRKRDRESGKYTGEFSDEDFLTAIRELGGSGGTTEIAEQVGCDRRTAYVRLNDLEDENAVSSRKVGNALLWSIEN